MNLDLYHELREECLHEEHFGQERILDVCSNCSDTFFVGDEVPLQSELDARVCFCSENCQAIWEFENKHDYIN